MKHFALATRSFYCAALFLALVFLVASSSAQNLVYVVDLINQFGTVDLATGAFNPIGSTTPEGQANLVWGSDGMLFSLTYSGNLEKINPVTGQTTVIGQTGLGYNAFELAGVRGKLYATDFSNNIYSVDPQTGIATFMRATGIPPDPNVPFSQNSDGTINLCDETLNPWGGKLYATFDSFKVDPNTLRVTPVVNAALYEIDPSTGEATMIGPTKLGLGASVFANGQFYAIESEIVGWNQYGPVAQNQLYMLDLKSGTTEYVRDLDSSEGAIFGAAPVRMRATQPTWQPPDPCDKLGRSGCKATYEPPDPCKVSCKPN
jgi:hypothetical protein